jgi:hypothetical protein
VNGSGDDVGGDESFADVVNNLSGGPWRSRRRRRRQASPTTAQPVSGVQSVNRVQSLDRAQSVHRARSVPGGRVPAGSDDWREPALPSSVVRPYTWTRGRTSPVFDLAVETLVSTTQHGHEMAVLTCEEHRSVAELCSDPRSVAEVAALLSLPLGVARVLLADMADIGLVVVHQSAYSAAETPDVALMERVLSGLRRL